MLTIKSKYKSDLNIKNDLLFLDIHQKHLFLTEYALRYFSAFKTRLLAHFLLILEIQLESSSRTRSHPQR